MSLSRADLIRKYRIAPRGQRQAALKALQAATQAALASEIIETCDGTPKPARRRFERSCAVSASNPSHHPGATMRREVHGQARTARVEDGKFQQKEMNDATGNL